MKISQIFRLALLRLVSVIGTDVQISTVSADGTLEVLTVSPMPPDTPESVSMTWIMESNSWSLTRV